VLIGITYDLQEDYRAQGFSAEDAAEFDRSDTIDAIAETLAQLGHRPDPIGNLDALMQRLQNGERWDLVFNIAEGCYGFAREAQVPALLDAYRIPYTFSDAMTLGLCLHKGMCKRIVRDGGVPTPAFAVIETPSDADTVNLPFPLFAKPVAEGTGKGVSGASKVSDREALKRVCGTLLERFQQPVLVETYLPGREFTVGIVGTGRDARALGVMEVLFGEQAESTNYSYQNKTDWIGKLDYRIPEKTIAVECAKVALTAWRALGCRDAGRIDLRFDAAGCPQFIEVNPLAGINPDISDLCILCGLYGISYANLIGWIVESACTRMKNSPAKARSASRSVGCKPAFAARCLPLLPQEEGWDEGNQLPPSPNPLPEERGQEQKAALHWERVYIHGRRRRCFTARSRRMPAPMSRTRSSR
jgi:D-alanine-D-alanine ligase